MRVRRTAVRIGTGLFVGSATLMFAPGAALADPGADHGANGDRVTICHATGSASNPFVVITPSAEGVLHGHYDHQDQRDIIPPFSVGDESYPGLNWGSGQTTFDNGCQVPERPGTPGTPGNSGGGSTSDDGSTPGGDKLKVTICHATGSQTNPFVVISPAAEGVVEGHYAHQDQRDIIPPFTFDEKNYPGQNWDSEGKAVYDHGCTAPDMPATPGTPAGSAGSTVTTAAGAHAPTSTSAAGTSVNSPAATYTAPSGSVHAGQYDNGLSAEQGVGIALAATAAVGAVVAVARRRLGRVRA
jgi:hypothetical protein